MKNELWLRFIDACSCNARYGSEHANLSDEGMYPSGDATLCAHSSTAVMTVMNWKLFVRKRLGQLGSTVPTFGETEVDTKRKIMRMADSSTEIRIGAAGFR